MFLFSLVILIAVFIIVKLYIKATTSHCKNYVSLVGKTVLITGGNSGLGLQLAKNLAARGCSVVIANRTDATETVKALKNETRNPHIYYHHVDFTSFKSVKQFAKEFKENYEQLHILVNNAGIPANLTGITDDGLQTSMQVNYFSHFLLTHLLLEVLLKSAPSRILFNSSLAAYLAKIKINNITGYQDNRELSLPDLYYSSKAALAMMSAILSKKLARTGVTSNAQHPGIIRTNIFKTSVPLNLTNVVTYYLLSTYAWFFGKTVQEGVQTMLYLATANEAENISGMFFMECKPVQQPKPVYDRELCEKVWVLSERYTKLEEHEKTDSIIKRFQDTKKV